MTRQFLQRFVLLLISSALSCANGAYAGSPLSGTGTQCGAISRVDRTCSLSRPTPPYSPMIVSTAADPKLDACEEKVRGRILAESIASCEAYLDAGRGTPRQSATAMFYLGHAYTYAGKMDEATAVWKLATETDPSYREPYLYLGLWATLSADPLSALPYFDSVLRYDADDAQARTGRARAYLSANRLNEALKESELAIALDPKDPIARQMHGSILERLEYYMEAAAEYSFAAEGYDFREGWLIGLYQDRNPWLEMARAFDRAGKPQEAAAAVDRFAATLPAGAIDSEIYLARAGYLEHAGNYSGAADDIAKAVGLTRDKQEAESLNFRRAILIQKSGNPEKALREMELLLRSGGVQMVLRIQVLLKNAGHPIEINGAYDLPTREALVDCIADPECGEVLGEKS